MTKYYCDICDKEITDWSKVSEFKVKERIYSFHERWWERLTVHIECWEELRNIIDEQKERK